MEHALTTFTPWSALAGGLAIGVSAAVYLLGVGRIAGIAGIVSNSVRGLVTRQFGRAEQSSLVFLSGLVAAPWVWGLFASLPPTTVESSPVGLVVAGLLVGVGVRMGNGCTSGHGVCGLSRLSVRSAINVACFMSAGFVTVFALRHLF
jgi:uncharacterized membrane protein YedE/YeeE